MLDHGQTVVRLPPQLMAGARDSVRERGKSDPIDALAVARAGLREGIDTLPTARLTGPELEIRLLVVHRERLVDARSRLICELRWQLHDLWPDWEIPERVLIGIGWQRQVARRLQRAQPCARVIARDEIRRINLTRTINDLHQQIVRLIKQNAPDLLAERGLGALLAAKLIGEIARSSTLRHRRTLARMAGCAPIPVSSGRTDRRRLDRGGNRRSTTRFTCTQSASSATTPRPPSTSPSSANVQRTASAPRRCLIRRRPPRDQRPRSPPPRRLPGEPDFLATRASPSWCCFWNRLRVATSSRMPEGRRSGTAGSEAESTRLARSPTSGDGRCRSV